MDPDSRAQTAACRVQAQVEEATAKKPGPAILVVSLKGLERLDVRVDPREAGDRDSMEEAKVSRVLADDVPGHVGQTANFQ